NFLVSPNGTASGFTVVFSSNSVPVNQWTYLAATYDGATLRMYVNGVLHNQTPFALSIFPGTNALGIGANVGGLAAGNVSSPFVGLFVGKIDEPSLYNQALTAAKIQTLFGAGVTGKCQEPPSILLHPTSQKLTVGEDVHFTVVAAGTPTLKYQWRFNGTNLAGATSTSLTLANVSASNAGLYSVRVTNAFGSIISSNAVLTVNTFPTALAQSVTLDEDTSTNLTAQAADLEGDPLTYQLVTPPVNGTLTGTLPNVIYTPAQNYHGPDSFTFKVNDGLVDSPPAVVSLTVLPVNDPPVALAQSVALDEDTTVTLTLGAFDVDGDPLTFSVGAPAHGSLTGSPPNLTYRPNTNFNGPDNFLFSVSDGQTNSLPATVSIMIRPVNDAPFAKISVSPLAEFAGVTNQILIAPVCGNARVVLDGSASSDVEDDPLQFFWTEGTNTFATGSIVTNEFAPDTHIVTLTVSDGQAVGTATTEFEVLTPSECLGLMIAEVEESFLGRRNARAFVASLRAAASSFDRCDLTPGLNQLRAFQNKVRAQIAPSNPTLAAHLISEAQQIIDALSPPD
ncbi:MAG: tandem-95 repeat protein, partial [Pedosphaera sp.]|nr:tandem-95 repeat protein [Pedosphaera sp.]